MCFQLLIASGNPGKIKEFQDLLSGLPLQLRIPQELGVRLDVEETGSTYAQNAAIKAKAFSKATGLLALADDSGLEVDALNGAPGIRSARFAPQPGATDADRRNHLLQQLNDHPRPWIARFRCVVAIAAPTEIGRKLGCWGVRPPNTSIFGFLSQMTGSETMYYGEGSCEGRIIPGERGLGGFGYDPIFWVAQKGVTMAELPFDEKNRLSHRALAVRAITPALKMLIRQAHQ